MEPVICKTCHASGTPHTSTRDHDYDRKELWKYDDKGGVIPEKKYEGYTCSNGHHFEIKVSED